MKGSKIRMCTSCARAFYHCFGAHELRNNIKVNTFVLKIHSQNIDFDLIGT